MKTATATASTELDPVDERQYSLSIFFPCCNEQGAIERLTITALEVGRAVTRDLEIIIIDDGSTDKTAEIADRLANAIPKVKAVHHAENRGYGAALRSGFASSTKTLVCYTDGDAQFDIRELPRLIPLIRKCDIVSGYRRNRAEGFSRKMMRFCWRFLVKGLLGRRIRDINCAF